jgi:uncharacterized protein YidB (DUF937 family)
MSLFDDLKKQVAVALGLPEGTDPTAAASSPLHSQVIDRILEMLNSHGLGNLSDKFQRQGLGEVFQSWVGKGANLPISPDQVRSVVDPAALEKLAQQLGFPEGKVTALLAQLLPGIVDKLTPNGALQDVPPTKP